MNPQDSVVENVENMLGPVSTRNLLVCFLWVMKSIDKDLMTSWWYTLSITRLDSLLNVLDLCVSCFEYRVSFVYNCRIMVCEIFG